MTVASELGPERAVSSRRESWRRGLYRFRQSWLSVLGLAIVLLLFGIALLGPALAPYPEHVAGGVSTATRFQPPSARHWFGTNELGQDVFSLVLAGARVSLFAGFAVVALGAAVGTLVGAVAGYVGGWTDEALMRLADLKLTVPGLILAMAVAAALGPGIGNMIAAIALSWWPAMRASCAARCSPARRSSSCRPRARSAPAPPASCVATSCPTSPRR
jgi:peptide/nickel transport system permease protein